MLMNQKTIDQIKLLIRSTSFTDAEVTEARTQVERENFARSEEARKPLFDKAVKMLRHGDSVGKVDADLQRDCERLGLDSFQIACDARNHVEKVQREAWEEAIQSFQNGADDLTVIRRLMEHGFSPFDAEQVAYRAKKKAAEQAA